MLKVKLLTKTAKAPTIGHPGEDIAYDFYADETVQIPPGELRPVRLGVAVEFVPKAGMKLEARSGDARKLDVAIEGGIIDAGYRGELTALIRNMNKEAILRIVQGEKCVQGLEHRWRASKVQVVQNLSESKREDKGFGSTGKK